jgi:glycosyltransferase involved in cell wall biosynthesis
MSKKSSFALIVPCYNEAGAIPLFETEALDFKSQFELAFQDFSFKLVFVDNNSSDSSVELLQLLVQQHSFVRVENCSVQGYGAALKHGFASVDADYMAFLDLDNTYPLISLIPMLNQLLEKSSDIVFGARIHTNSRISIVRKFGNLLYVLLLRWLLKSSLSDVCSGMRVFRGDLKPQILKLKSNDLSFSIEFTAYVVIEN